MLNDCSAGIESRQSDQSFIKVQTTILVVSFILMSFIGLWSMSRLRITLVEVLEAVEEMKYSKCQCLDEEKAK